MVAPKQKAEQLYTTYRKILSLPDNPLKHFKPLLVKECAIVAANEAQQVCVASMKEYWNEVKNELTILHE
jgi:hypothetical protein